MVRFDFKVAGLETDEDVKIDIYDRDTCVATAEKDQSAGSFIWERHSLMDIPKRFRKRFLRCISDLNPQSHPISFMGVSVLFSNSVTCCRRMSLSSSDGDLLQAV